MCNVCGEVMPLDDCPGALAVLPDGRRRLDFCETCSGPLRTLVERLLAEGRLKRATRSIAERARDLGLAEHFGKAPGSIHEACVPPGVVTSAEPVLPDALASRSRRRLFRQPV